MSAGIIDIHEDYVLKKINLINPDNINLVVDSESRFTDAFSLRVLFEYLQRTKDADTVLKWYNELPTSQSEERTATIKSYISETYLNSKSAFVEDAVKYLPLLGQDFVFTLTKDYLIRTHSTKPILNQLACAKGEYYENLSTFLFGFHKNYEKFIDENFIEPFCKSSMSISHPSLNNEYMIAIIKLYVSNFSSYEKAMKFAKDYNSEVATQIENHLVSILDRKAYMQLWEEGICEQLPDGYLDDYFDDNEYKYEKANKWLEQGRLGKEAVVVAMERTLKKIKGITFYRYFKTEYLIYFYVLDKQWDMSCLSLIDDKHREWFDWTRKLSYKDFDAVCSIFVLMPESIQVRLLKYIFLCIAAEKYSIRAADLRNLENCLPQYKNYDSSDKPFMSLSTSVIVESLCVYEKEGHFISDKEFYTLLYKYCKNGNCKVTVIDSFFDRCTGKFKRYYPSMHEIERFIYPIKDNRGGIQYIINFNYDAQIVAHVREITGRRFHPNFKVWFAPGSSLPEIEQFAKNFKFLLLHKEYNISDIGKSAERILENYTDSEYREAVRGISELKEWKEDMPHITFCEGRESQKKEEADVWWCVGHNPCNNCAITLHPIEKWQDYTLYDFCKILGFDLVEENRYGHFCSGKYALFITSINRFNNLLEHLYCRECGEILYPVENNYSVVGATTFHCINEKCSQFHKSVYLNHCYKKKCRGIIDSRDEARCPNNLVICKSCGTCCSTEMFRYRLDKLQRTGSQCYFTIRDLIYKIEHNEGHAEDQKFYCYHCGALLKGYISNTVCESCGSSINYKSY